MAVKFTADELEAQQLHYWHLDRFEELGFEIHQASILELAHVDWREAAHLLELGCPPAIAIRILT